MMTAARLAAYRSYRDEISRKFMLSVGFDARNDPIYPDLAFGMPLPASPATRCVRSERCAVSVGVMTYYGWEGDTLAGARIFERYLDKITGFVKWLVDQGHSVRLVIGDRGDTIAVNRVIEAIAGEAGVTGAERVEAHTIASVSDVGREIQATDLYVGTRFHNIVCALMLEKPVVSLGYAEKNDALLTEMGLGKYCQHIEHFELATLIAHFCELRDNRNCYIEAIRERKCEYRRHLAEQFSQILPATGESSAL
jgi:polysaccharide pyruvyl transferase WcaK-like protein